MNWAQLAETCHSLSLGQGQGADCTAQIHGIFQDVATISSIFQLFTVEPLQPASTGQQGAR